MKSLKLDLQGDAVFALRGEELEKKNRLLFAPSSERREGEGESGEERKR